MDNPFSQIFDKKAENALGIDIGSSSIKAVQLKKKGNKAVLETYGELSLGPYSGVEVGQATNLGTDKLIEAMKDLLDEKEVAITTRNCGMAIPFHASLLKVIQLPKVKDKDLASMIPLEARKYIPVPISEVSLDWSIIPKNENMVEATEAYEDFNKKKEEKPALGMEDILLVAIHNNIINQYKQIISTVGLDVSFFEIELFSSMRSILDDNSKSIMIIDMGAASTKTYIVERGILRSSHLINRGSQDITENIARQNGITFEEAEIVKRSLGLSPGGEIKVDEAVSVSSGFIFSEVNRVMFDYQSQMKTNIEKVVLIGGGAALKGIKDIAKESLKTEVVLGDPFSKVEAPAFLQEILSETGPEFAVSVGVALRKLSEI